jgi:4-hydroxy-tetrahydrodipicolinate reductase
MIRIIQLGLGPLGQKVASYALQREGVKIVGAVDLDTEKVGKDVGQLCAGKSIGVEITKTLDEALERAKADVAVLTTVSSLEKVEPQIKELAEAQLPMVSTCEELSFPWITQPMIAKRIDKVCKSNGVACVGTGVNPGFLMDYLPSVLSSVCQNVQAVHVSRVQDASVRRIPFQQKIGVGLTEEGFKEKANNGTLRHVGLTESIHLIAHALNWELDRIEETLEPVRALEKITSGYIDIDKDNPRGVLQIGRGFIDGDEKITLHFRAAVGEEESYDEIEIEGTPSFSSRISGGINGDIATSAITVNAVAAILKAEPGLRTMLDIPVPACFSTI